MPSKQASLAFLLKTDVKAAERLALPQEDGEVMSNLQDHQHGDEAS